MKRGIFLVFLAAILVLLGQKDSFGQAQSHDGGSSHVLSIERTFNSGYILAGYEESSNGNNDMLLIKLNRSMVTEWEKTYGGEGNDGAQSIQQTPDGGYIVSGFTESYGKGKKDMWILKLDASGSSEWEKTYGGKGNDEAHSIHRTLDGGYLVAGFTESFGKGKKAIWVLKLNSAGDVEWQTTAGSHKADAAYSAYQAFDGGYLVAGYEKPARINQGRYKKNITIIKFNRKGGLQWRKFLGGKDYGEPTSIRQTSDGGYFVTGIKRPANQNGIWAIKMDGKRKVQWVKSFENDDSRYAKTQLIREGAKGGFVIAGYDNDKKIISARELTKTRIHNVFASRRAGYDDDKKVVSNKELTKTAMRNVLISEDVIAVSYLRLLF